MTDTAGTEAGARFHPRHHRWPTAPRGARRRSSRAFRRSRTAISISATPSRSASISASPQEYGGRCAPALRRHQPGEGGAGIYRRHRARRALARLRLGRPSPSRLGLFRAALRLGRASDPARRCLCRRSAADEIRAGARHADRAGPRQPLSATAPSRKISICSAACGPASFPNGARMLRAKIDMASGNINLRDPVLYRILHAAHPRTGTQWCIYPTYDFAHGQSDAIEGVTHSLCTLEFEDHRPLYDWLIEHLPVPSRPRQYEFARLNIGYTVLSKRVLTKLVREGHVAGWDDPRMPTLAGLRRRGVPPEAIRDFVAPRRRRARQQRRRYRHVRSRRARASQQDGAAPHGGAAAAEGGDRELSEGRVEELDAVNHPDDPAQARAKSRSAASSISSATISWRTRRRNSSACRPAARCGCAMPISSPAARW